MSKKILISPNAFKHSLSSIEVAEIVKSSLLAFSENIQLELAPIADGGDGTVDVLNYYFKKSSFIEAPVRDPLGRIINAKWLLLDKETAVIELAKASGLSLLKLEELNPMWANTFGLGELILSALNKGCKKIVVTLGGSATVDAGVGMLQALGVKFFDDKKHAVKAGGGFLSSISEINLLHLDKRIKNVTFHALCDVKIPLTGEKGSVNKFSSQKGATDGEKIVLEKGMKHYAQVVKQKTSHDFESEPMTGSAGGVAFSLKSILGAELLGGFSYLSHLISLEDKIKQSDIVITGEGCLDSQTILGKGVFEIVKIAKHYQKKVIVLCGTCDNSVNWKAQNIDTIIDIKPDTVSLEESLKKSKELLQNSIKTNINGFINY